MKLLIFIVAYNAEKTIESVLKRVPTSLSGQHETEILIIDDASGDRTWERAEEFRAAGTFPFKLTVLVNPVNQGYGGNQKIGFMYAIKNEFDVVALVHGDGQYAPEALPGLLQPLADGSADVVFGSRMMTAFGALKGGMPLYKYVGNRILTTFQNFILRGNLSEYHTGYRVYSIKALRSIPFQLNTRDFHFDTEIIIQLFFAGMRIKELPIPTYYGDEICYVNGLRYAWDVAVTTTLAKLQAFCLLYQPKFDVSKNAAEENYGPKLDFDSTHTRAVEAVEPDSKVVDLGCASGYLCRPLVNKGCTVIGIDQCESATDAPFHQFIVHDLNEKVLPIKFDDVDYILMLDIIEHLTNPERFVQQLSEACALSRKVKLIITTGNIAFVVTRLMLLLGQFNYGKKGILDLTHTRLYTFSALKALLQSNGFEILAEQGVPAPIPMVLKNRSLAQLLLNLNNLLIRLWRNLFAYQILMVARPLPSLDFLLNETNAFTQKRALQRKGSRMQAYDKEVSLV